MDRRAQAHARCRAIPCPVTDGTTPRPLCLALVIGLLAFGLAGARPAQAGPARQAPTAERLSYALVGSFEDAPWRLRPGHFGRIGDEWLPLMASLIGSTLLTIAVTALVLRALSRRAGGQGE